MWITSLILFLICSKTPRISILARWRLPLSNSLRRRFVQHQFWRCLTLVNGSLSAVTAVFGRLVASFGGTDSNADLRKLFQLQTGAESVGSTLDVLKHPELIGDLPKVHVVAAQIRARYMPTEVGGVPDVIQPLF